MNALEFITQNKKEIEAIFNDCSNNLFDAVSLEDLADAIESTEDIEDFIVRSFQESGLDQVEIIYYDDAMDYLKENDPSLTESLGLASDMGFELTRLNSEVLASLHATNAEPDIICCAAKSLAEFITTNFEG